MGPGNELYNGGSVNRQQGRSSDGSAAYVYLVRAVRKWGRGAKSPPTLVTGAPYFFTI